MVTPLAGVWIEIPFRKTSFSHQSVTPLAGVWIEIGALSGGYQSIPSHPSRVCGLK